MFGSILDMEAHEVWFVSSKGIVIEDSRNPEAFQTYQR